MNIKNNPLESPFRVYKDTSAVLTSERVTCSSSSIEAARSKGIITDIDMYILTAIYDFGIVNKNAVTFYINNSDTILSSIKKPDYTRNFRNLTEHGLLMRYSITSSAKCSPNIYTLSAGAKQYLSRIVGRGYHKRYISPDIDIAASPEAALRTVAFNQYYMRLVTSPIDIARILYGYEIKYKNHQIFLDAIVVINHMNQYIEPYELVYICLRNTSGWQQYFKNCAEAVYKNMSKLGLKEPVFVVIVESHIMASQAEKSREQWSDAIREIPSYYIPDVMVLENIDHVYKIIPGDSYSDYEDIPLMFAKRKK